MGCVFGKINEVYPSRDSLQPSVDTVLRCSKLCSDVYNTKNEVMIVSNLTSKYIVFEIPDIASSLTFLSCFESNATFLKNVFDSLELCF